MITVGQIRLGEDSRHWPANQGPATDGSIIHIRPYDDATVMNRLRIK